MGRPTGDQLAPARRRDERGVALPSPLVMLSVIAVAMAGLALLGSQDPATEQLRPVGSAPAATPSGTPGPSGTAGSSTPGVPGSEPEPERRPRPKLDRSSVFVEVYNNTGIQDLAASTALEADAAGWNIVGTDNWLGTIPATAVYYPPRLERAAKALARDLGIARTAPAIEPMKFDRLTVILALDYV